MNTVKKTKMNINIPNTQIAEAIGITEGAVRKAKANFQAGKSRRYLDYLEAFKRGISLKEYDELKIKEEINKIGRIYTENDKNDNDANIIAVVNFKGGVGKSTIAMLMREYLPDSLIVNLDYQEAEKINPENSTCDFPVLKAQEESLTLDEYIETMTTPSDDKDIPYYKNIILDTQGAEFNEDFDSVLDKITHFIVPMTPGKRSFEKTKMTIETLLDFVNPNAKWCVVVNNYVDDKQFLEEKERIEKEIKPLLGDRLVCISSLKNSKIVPKMENESIDLSKLSLRDRQQVKVFKQRVEKLNREIAEKLFS